MIFKLKDRTTWIDPIITIAAANKLNNAASFNVVDTETTGLKKEDKVVQVSLIHYGKQSGTYVPEYMFDSYIRQPRLMSKEASEVTGITDSMLATAPTQAEVFPKLQSAIGADDLFIAYNGQFDIKKLDSMWQEETGHKFPVRDDIDVMKIAQEIIPRGALIGYDDADITLNKKRSITAKKGSYKQTNVCRLLGVSIDGAHNALNDIQMTAMLLDRLLRIMQQGTRQEENLITPIIKKIDHQAYAHDEDYYFIHTDQGDIYYNRYDGRYYDKSNVIDKINMESLNHQVLKSIEEGKNNVEPKK